MRYRVVLDSNVILSALRSRAGASFLLSQRWLVGSDFDVCFSLALALEYEEILNRYRSAVGWDEKRIARFIAGLAERAVQTTIYFKWRPSKIHESTL